MEGEPMETDRTEENDSEQYFEIGATVISGLEMFARDECQEKLKCKAEIGRGRIYFNIAKDQLHSIVTLQAVNNLFVLVNKDKNKELDLYGKKDSTLEYLKELVTHQDWSVPLAAWKEFTKSSHHLERPQDGTKNQCDNLPIFRVTCTRSSKEGRKHEFSSQEAASATGGRINDIFGWPVKMKDFDMEISVDINDTKVVLGINLTSESLHRRNITHFGPTTLQSTIAYCMLRMSCPQVGDIICDPMCGGSSIPIEGARTWASCYFLSGDNVEIATEKSEGNITAIEEKRNSITSKGLFLHLDVFQWDVTNLPLRSNSVDVFITDLPFGKRMGSKLNNWELYRRGLTEMARVCKPGTGRAVLLTQDKKCMARVLKMTNHLWRKKYLQFIRMGGLTAGMYSLTRVGRAAQVAAQTQS
ncbi:tRNA (guanine(6)-N(2))-methyltransferase THUMP3-like [Amphiura filiformis]|uniref:tRNA (guanine(6)-N(2))-methyltransferase THUMP3-like n=1 Tax=Amphiura filiformis TaxID=82378 RepID=UPI003B2135EB